MEKCYLCDDEIKKTFLNKIVGTPIKIKEKDKTKIIYLCSSCQKKYKDNLKKEVERKN